MVKDNPILLLWLARFAIAMDVPDEWVPTKLPLIHQIPDEIIRGLCHMGAALLEGR
jgi:hypothetical protein